MRHFFNQIFQFITPPASNYQSLNQNQIRNIREKELDYFIGYLKELETQENERMQLIETKTMQMISQTGAIFSVEGFLIPFLIDKIADANPYFQFLICSFIVLTFYFFTVCILEACKNLNVKNFTYVKKSYTTVVNHYNIRIKKLKEIEVKDLQYAIPRNAFQNNIKASNLIISTKYFKYGIINLFLILVSFVLLHVFRKLEFQVSNPIEIRLIKEKKTVKSDTSSKAKYIR